MPKCYPDSLEHLDDRFNAEKQVFEYLKKLDNSYHVFHSVTWCGDREGECDFIIFHELKGFIALEVKGGKVAFDGSQWTSTDASGKVHNIHDPVQQARDAMYAVRKTWQDKFKAPLPGVYSWGVCFLDGSWSAAYETLDLKEYNVLDARKLDDVRTWVEGLFVRTQKRHSEKLLSKNDRERFLSLFSKEMEIPLSINRAIRRQETEMKLADLMQDYILCLFDDKPRIGFQGAAGTGKTWIAMKKMFRLNDAQKRTLFLCYNRQVNDFIAERMKGAEHVTVMTFHAFANSIIREFLEKNLINEGCRSCFFECIGNIAGELVKEETRTGGNISPDSKGDGLLNGNISGAMNVIAGLPESMSCSGILKTGDDVLPEAIREVVMLLLPDSGGGYYEDRLPLAVMAVLEADPVFHRRFFFDALVIDEAQDFHKNWCECLKYLYKNFEDRICYIFYDDNQTIFTKQKDLPVKELIDSIGIEDHIFRLRDNLRNTAEIHDFAVGRTGRGGTSRSLAIPGLEPIVKTFKDETEAAGYVADVLNQLILEQGLEKERIVVLSNRSLEHSIFSQNHRAGGFNLVPTGMGQRENSVRFRTIQKFKGLESDITIMIVHQRAEDRDSRYNSVELLYIGYSRARHLLYVVEVGDAPR